MKNKNTIFYVLLLMSIGYLLYSYTFVDYRYGMMMDHHYDYYGSRLVANNFVDSIFVFIAYSLITLSLIVILPKKWKSSKNTFIILDTRLSKGEISIDEYRLIKKELGN